LLARRRSRCDATNTLHALIDRILDVMLAYLLIARERLVIRRTD